MFDIKALMREHNKKTSPKAEALRKKAKKMFDDFQRKGAYVEVQVQGDLLPCTGIRKVGEDYFELDLFATSPITGGRVSSKHLIHKSQLVLTCDQRVKGGSAESCPKTYEKFRKILGE